MLCEYTVLPARQFLFLYIAGIKIRNDLAISDVIFLIVFWIYFTGVGVASRYAAVFVSLKCISEYINMLFVEAHQINCDWLIELNLSNYEIISPRRQAEDVGITFVCTRKLAVTT